jgi:hypothetical protein
MFNSYAYTDPDTKETTVYDIETDLIPEDSLLRVIYDRRQPGSDIVYTDDPNIAFVAYYLNDKPMISDPGSVAVLDYWGVYASYEVIWARELIMRENMYNPEYFTHPMNTDGYYGLTDIETFLRSAKHAPIVYYENTQ